MLIKKQNKKCIIFILKNDEYFLTHNIDQILDFANNYDLLFVVRSSKDRTIEILKSNNFIILDLSYDAGYEEALKTGLEFVETKNYDTIVEFGEINNIALHEIDRLNDINQEFGNNKEIIFASKINKQHKKRKWFIYLSIFKKVKNPYTRFRIYNKNALKCLKSCFGNKLYTYNFIILLYMLQGNYIEVKVKNQQSKRKIKHKLMVLSNKFDTFIYTIFITPFIKKFKIDNCEHNKSK